MKKVISIVSIIIVIVGIIVVGISVANAHTMLRSDHVQTERSAVVDPPDVDTPANVVVDPPDFMGVYQV